MSEDQRYCTVPVAEYDNINMEQVAATYGREVVLNPPIVAMALRDWLASAAINLRLCTDTPHTLLSNGNLKSIILTLLTMSILTSYNGD